MGIGFLSCSKCFISGSCRVVQAGLQGRSGQLPTLVFRLVFGYSKIMDIEIKFSQSAFKHGFTDADVRMAFDNVLYDERLDDSDDKADLDAQYLLIGFDLNANPLEILYNIIDENTIKVFHAMRCRNILLPLINYRRK